MAYNLQVKEKRMMLQNRPHHMGITSTDVVSKMSYFATLAVTLLVNP